MVMLSVEGMKNGMYEVVASASRVASDPVGFAYWRNTYLGGLIPERTTAQVAERARERPLEQCSTSTVITASSRTYWQI